MKSQLPPVVLTPIMLVLAAIALAAIAVDPALGGSSFGLRVSEENPHYLATRDGEPFFLNVDAVWGIVWRIPREDVEYYLQRRKQQRFNCIHFCAFPNHEPWNVTEETVYGDKPFALDDKGWDDPLRPLVTAGNDPDNPEEYDYWDHVDYIVDLAEQYGMYVMLLPTYGNLICGSFDGSVTSQIIFNEKNAYAYGNWLANRYRDKKHIIWVMGGDRDPVYGGRDYRPVINAMAEGVADGVNGVSNQDGDADYTTTFMTYHPRKWSPNSSRWFHDAPWLDFNSVQDMPLDQIASVTEDWRKTPVKPTWLYEGRYELFVWGKAIYKAWQTRYQAYQTVFAGGAGITYSCHGQYDFRREWKTRYLNRPGAEAMTHLYHLMTVVLSDQEYMDRIPDQNLIANRNRPRMSEVTLVSDEILGTRGKDGGYALVYTARGAKIKVFMDLLEGPSADAYWYNPRTGLWHVEGKEYNQPRPFAKKVPAGPGSPVSIFDPPGNSKDGNDWVLRLVSE